MTARTAELTRSFEAENLDPGAFRHSDHVAVAYEMLRRYGFMNAAARYGTSLHAIATKAGAPDKFNATITIAFMSLIAERMDQADCTDYDDFIAQNSDLLSKDVLKAWYSPERLESPLARNTFLMPDLALPR